MKYLIALLLTFNAYAAPVKLGDLPLGTGSSTVSDDSFPYTDSVTITTKRLRFGDIINIPSISSHYAPLASPTFTGTVTATTFVGALTGVASGNISLTPNNHGIVLSSATTAATVLAPSSSTAFPLVSGGASASPVWANLGVAGGGTGVATFTAYGILTAGTTSTGALQQVSGTGTSGQVLVSAGAGALPAWGAIGIAGGGTGLSTLATYTLLTGGTTATGALQQVSSGSVGQILFSAGSGALPSWQTQGNPVIQTFTSGSSTYYPDYIFTVTSASATAASTYTNNSITCTTEYTIASATTLIMACQGVPTTSGTLTKSAGTGDSTITFSLYQRPKWIEVIASGGGGGGGASTSPAAGSAGGTTTFGSTIISCTGGGFGGDQGTPASVAGGTCTITGAGQDLDVVNNVVGSPSAVEINLASQGGINGSTNPLGGGGAAGISGANGSNAPANTGSGGGGSGSNGATNAPGAGGAAGGYADIIIRNFAALSEAVVIGAAGSGRTGTRTGGNGAAGVVVVKQYY